MRINSFFVCHILVVFEMQSFGTSLVRLKSITTGRYLTMRRNGTLRGLVSEEIIIVGEGVLGRHIFKASKYHQHLTYICSTIEFLSSIIEGLLYVV